jgi:hypothetical protein
MRGRSLYLLAAPRSMRAAHTSIVAVQVAQGENQIEQVQQAREDWIGVEPILQAGNHIIRRDKDVRERERA